MHRVSELYTENAYPYQREGEELVIETAPLSQLHKKLRVNILALGDVGGTVLLGLRLLGADVIAQLGIYDLNQKTLARYEAEINQVISPEGGLALPPVTIVADPLDCDVAIFCATAGVPPVDTQGNEDGRDVRMAQLRANKKIIDIYCKMAREKGYQGAFFVVSDPVDPLCAAAACGGFAPDKVRGFGLGVMNARALYYADDKKKYDREGRVFGPHGEDLVVADSIIDYDHDYSMELTRKTVESNLKTRALGFKPYIAPAMSSATLSILALLRGQEQYSSLWFGKAFLGVRNKVEGGRTIVEDRPLEDRLFQRICHAYDNLASLKQQGLI